MRKGALLIFDFWHDSAVQFKGPSSSIKSFYKDGLKFNKFSNGKVDYKNNTIKIEIITNKEKNGSVISKSKESHLLKYYNLNSLSNLMKLQGFEDIIFEDFNKEGQKPSNKNWNVYCVSKFRG